MWTNIINKAKKSVAILFVFVVALVVGAATRLQPSTAHADNTVEFHQVGASVRMGDQLGIRFAATINKIDAAANYYVMIIPETWVAAYDLDEEGNEDYYDVLYKKGKRSEIDKQEDEEISMLVMQCQPTYQSSGDYAGLYLIRGSIVDVKYENSNTKFFGVAFEEKNGTRVYADSQEQYSYRNITNIASAALNDTKAEYSEDNKASLKQMVKDAYNVSLGYNKDTVELPTMSVHPYNQLSVQNGSTYQASVQDLPDIGIKVDWRLESGTKDFKSTIDQNGKITVLDEDIICNGYAKVLGEDIKFAVNPTAKPATGVLEDFASSSIRYSFGRGGVVNIQEADSNGVLQYKGGQIAYTDTNTAFLDYTGVEAYGVTGTYISRGSSIKDVTFRFALSAEDLKTAISEAKNVTVRMMVGTYYRNGVGYNDDSAEKGYVKFVGRDFVVPHNTWVDLTVTKTEFLNFFAGANETEKLNNFSALGANNGKGIAGFTVCESYTINGAAADCEMLFDAIYTDKATVAPLESTAARMNINLNGGTYLESYNGEKDVIRVTRKDNSSINAKFALTADELSQITSVSFKILFVPSGTLTKDPMLRYNRGQGSTATGLVQQSVTPNVWTTITYKKEQLCYKFLGLIDGDKSNASTVDEWKEAINNPDKMATAWTNFCNACSLNAGYAPFVSMLDVSVSTDIYFAEVTFNYD